MKKTLRKKLPANAAPVVSMKTRILTVSAAKPKLGAILDGVAKGEQVMLRRHDRLYRFEIVEQIEPIPVRPIGYFDDDGPDEMTDLANSALITYPAQR